MRVGARIAVQVVPSDSERVSHVVLYFHDSVSSDKSSPWVLEPRRLCCRNVEPLLEPVKVEL